MNSPSLMPVFSRVARFSAGLIALMLAACFAVQIVLTTAEQGSLLAGFWQLSRYFTILTNLALGITMAMLAMGCVVLRSILHSLTTAILAVGIVFHIALADLIDPQGWGIVTNQVFHTAAPMLGAVWWLAFAPARPHGWRRLGWVIIWPILYALYVLARGAATGVYPYPFMDLPQLGWARLILNMAVLSAGFVAIGALLNALVQLRIRLQAPRRSTI